MKLFLYCEYSTWVTDNNAVFSEDCKGSVCVWKYWEGGDVLDNV